MARGRNLEHDKDIYDTIYIYYSFFFKSEISEVSPYRPGRQILTAPSTVKKQAQNDIQGALK